MGLKEGPFMARKWALVIQKDAAVTFP
jgi:hypothetical protein